MSAKTVRFEEVKAQLLQDPAVREAYEELEPAYQVARLRIQRGLTQKELADLVGTKQPSIARLESGKTRPSLPFLQRVVEALGGHLIVKIELQNPAPAARHGG
jgi:DNA-binding XRE family transcriptional regulator